MTLQQLAEEIMSLSDEEMDTVLQIMYEEVSNPESYNERLMDLGIDISEFCKRKHPPAG